MASRCASPGTAPSLRPGHCRRAVNIVAFCHGPMCLQSPAGIASIVRLGYPVGKIAYYRGGMTDWEALGLTTVTGHRPLRTRPVP